LQLIFSISRYAETIHHVKKPERTPETNTSTTTTTNTISTRPDPAKYSVDSTKMSEQDQQRPKPTPFPHGVFLPNGLSTDPPLPANDPTVGYKLNHFMMRIRDPEKSMKFYIELMGMRTVFTYVLFLFLSADFPLLSSPLLVLVLVLAGPCSS
jgi:hypothetical protein